jgi:hypothetical protein
LRQDVTVAARRTGPRAAKRLQHFGHAGDERDAARIAVFRHVGWRVDVIFADLFPAELPGFIDSQSRRAGQWNAPLALPR